MGSFKFSLEPVLNHRVEVEEERKTDYQQAISYQQQQVEKVNKINQKLQQLNAQLQVNGVVNITELIHLNAYREQLKEELSRQLVHQAESEKKCDLAQQKLIEATLDVQVLEKLKDKKLELYHHEEKVEEIKLLDELACIKYARS